MTPTPRPLRRARRTHLGPIFATLALVAALSACSGEVSTDDGASIDRSEIETVVAGNITGADADAVDVTCDGDLEAEVGATQDCQATLEGRSTGIRVTVDQVNDEDVDFSTVFFVTAEELETSVGDYYTDQGIDVTGVTCDGELLGEPGDTARCDITSSNDGNGTVEATSTGADDLAVSFELEILDEG